MSSRSRPPVERDYEVAHFEGGHDHEPSVLADVSALHQEAPATPAAPGAPGGAGGTGPAADPRSNDSMLAVLQAERAESGDLTPAQCVEVDPELLEQARSTLQTGITDWAVTDGDAQSTISVLEGASLEQQEALIDSLRSSGDLDTLLDNLPEDAYENMSGPLGALLTPDRVADQLDGWWVSDADATGAMDLVTTLPPDQQAAALAEMDGEDLALLLEEIPDDRMGELQTAFEATTDPERKLQLWEAIHGSRAQAAHDSGMEDLPGWWEWGDEAEAREAAITHRNSQRDATLASTNAEIADEVAVFRERIANGETIDPAEIDAMDRRKRLEHDLETEYGVNITNDRGQAATDDAPETQRRVWSEDELHSLEGAFQRMPAAHVRDNPAFTEVRRRDVARRQNDDGDWEERTSVGASAGGGLISFYDTGAGARAGDTGEPWRTDQESELSGHDANEQGAEGATHLIQEVLSHELGHTVHQGDSELESDFHSLSDWQRHDADSARQALIDGGMTEEQADTALENLENTRDDGYGSRNQEHSGGDMFQVNPYDSDGYLSVDENAIDPNDSDWAYAESNPSDHFAEIYTKAIHAPESLHEDLISGPAQALADSEADLARQRATYDSAVAAGLLPEEDLEAMRVSVEAAESAVESAQSAADIRQSQHEFFRERVFGVDDSDIQAMEAPPGKEAVYAEFQEQAAMCMTPQQLAALRLRYEDRL